MFYEGEAGRIKREQSEVGKSRMKKNKEVGT